MEFVRRVKPVRVIPIVDDSPCPFELLAPLLASEEGSFVPPPTRAAAAAAPPPLAVAHMTKPMRPKQEGSFAIATTEPKPLVPAPLKRRKRVGVSDERAAEIAEQIARNGQRLGIVKRVKGEGDHDVLELE